MTLWNKEELLKALGDEIIANNITSLLQTTSISIDSRKIDKDSIFIALVGENNDGHNYLESVFNSGSKLAIIEVEEIFEKYRNNFSLILVKSTFIALYKLADYSRFRSKAKIIGVTGSVGKTSVKEMLKLAFSSQGKTFATQGNLNNHIGLPLSLANMPKDSEYGIFEIGMNHIGEIAPLSELTRPDLAIITNVTSAHLGNFKNEEEIAMAKSEIFLGLAEEGLILLNHDNRHFNFLQEQALKLTLEPKNIITFGHLLTSDYTLDKIEIINANHSIIKVKTKKNQEISYLFNSVNKAAIFNSLIIATSLDLIGKDVKAGLKALSNFYPPKGRGNIIEINSDKKITLIDDSYNANLTSLISGLEYLLDLKNILSKKRSVAILGDMLELGDKSIEIHLRIANYLDLYKIDEVILVGNFMKNLAEKLDSKNCHIYPNSNSLALEIKNLIKDEDVILIKGSRGMKMEIIVNELENNQFKND
jgi:UDP-N-acetylmuramoyl-tripeptide--D-alanyl-D-alanine ligase